MPGFWRTGSLLGNQQRLRPHLEAAARTARSTRPTDGTGINGVCVCTLRQQLALQGRDCNKT
eukprot:1142603-Pelagomonas_calceolata.AAC.3